jgi:hypothetical protein
MRILRVLVYQLSERVAEYRDALLAIPQEQVSV